MKKKEATIAHKNFYKSVQNTFNKQWEFIKVYNDTTRSNSYALKLNIKCDDETFCNANKTRQLLLDIASELNVVKEMQITNNKLSLEVESYIDLKLLIKDLELATFHTDIKHVNWIDLKQRINRALEE